MFEGLLDFFGIKKQPTFSEAMEKCKRKETSERKYFRGLRKKHQGAR